jgi:hypothetical protein
VTRGSEGRDAVAPLPEPIEGASWHVGTLARGTSSGGEWARWQVGEGN